MNNTLVRISTLAILAAPHWWSTARAQNLQITCKQDINIGNLIAYGCSGQYVISPDGNHNDMGGCLILNNSAQEGSCDIKVVGKAATKGATATFTKTFFTLSGTKGGTAKMSNLRMKLGSMTTIASQLTMGNTTVDKDPTLFIGGTLNYSDNQTAGSYVGNVAIKIEFTP